MPTADEADALRQRALRLLARREHSRLELERKLLPGEQGSTATLEAVLDQLEQDGCLADARFAAAYVAERFEKGFGPLRVRAELQTKGIGEALIDEHLYLDDDSCFELLCRADHKWSNANPGLQPPPFADETQIMTTRRRETARRARFLESRGFPTHLIARLLRQDEAF